MRYWWRVHGRVCRNTRGKTWREIHVKNKRVGKNNTPWAESLQITSVNCHYDQIARKCVSLILEAAKKQRQSGCHQIFKFTPELVVRESCGCNFEHLNEK